MAVLNLTGTSTQITSLSTAVLASQNIEGTGLLLRGRKAAAVWCSSGGFSEIARIAEPYKVDHVANWIGHAPLQSILSETKKAEGKLSHPNRRFAATLALTIMALGIGFGTMRAAGTETPNNVTAGITKLVVNDSACGTELLHTLHLSAEAAGYAVETSRVRTKMVAEPQFDLLLPALVITPPVDASHQAKSLLLPVTAVLAAGEKITFSLHIVNTPKDTTAASEITLRIKRTDTRETLAVSTTPTSARGWTLALLSWQASAKCEAGALAVEISIHSSNPVTITFPRSFVTKN